MRERRAILPGLVLGCFALSGHGAAAGGIAPDRAEELKNLVAQDCGSCHGLTRRGGLGSPLTAEALTGRDASAIAGVILDGLPGTAMPPWRPLMSEADALWIADYLIDEGPE